MRTVRKTSLRWFYCSLGEALPPLVHPTAKGLETLWNPVIARLRRFFYLYFITAPDLLPYAKADFPPRRE